MGAYHPQGNQVPMIRDSRWHGLVPQLFEKLAEEARFTINMTEAPLSVYKNSGFESKHTQCVHAASLGMLDMCASLFSITSSRALMTPFFTLESHPIYLVVQRTTEIPFGEHMTVD